MYLKKTSTTIILIFAINLTIFGANAIHFAPSTEIVQDSLVIKKNKSKKKITIKTGQEIKIWQEVNGTESGEFKTLQGDSLIILSKNGTKSIHVNNIKKIKIYNNPILKFIGSLFFLTGAGGIFLGGISLIAGIAALLADDLGAIILVAVPVLVGGGFGFYKFGEFLSGRKINLKNKWSIVTNK